MYYVDTLTGQTVTDSFIPFVQTISDVARSVDRDYFEINAGVRMPALQGTNAYFFPDMAVPKYKTHYVHTNQLAGAGHTRIGYLTSGIQSPELNISETDPSLSFAGQQVFEVYLNNDTATGFSVIENEVLNFYCYPNPATQQTEVYFELPKPSVVKIEVMDMAGRMVKPVCNEGFATGKQKISMNMSGFAKGVYNCVITAGKQRKSIRLRLN
jgi:hypothetical protein